MNNPLASNPVIADILKKARTRTYTKGQIILYPNETTSDLFVIKHGAVTMQDRDDEQNQKVLHIFGPSTLFPMTSFSTDTVPTSWYYVALTTTEVSVLPYLALKARLDEASGDNTYNLLLRQLLEEIHELLLRLSNMTKTDSYQKLLATLQFLASHHTHSTRGNWRQVNFPVSHQLLADMTGLTRETVTVTFKRLQSDKIVRSPALTQLEINDTALRTLRS